jgi:RNA polymerase sigma-70 factor (ECF subfamily)
MTALLLSDCIARAQTGDSTSLEALALMIRPTIERQLLRYPLSDEDRADVLQTALMQVVRRIGSFRGDSSFTTWLFRVTANEALMLMRSQRRHRKHLAADVELDDLDGRADDATQVDAMAEDGEREPAVRSALGRLPEHYRDVVTAHYHEDLGLHEIAGRLHVTESAVRSRLHRARSVLREILTENFPETVATA